MKRFRIKTKWDKREQRFRYIPQRRILLLFWFSFQEQFYGTLRTKMFWKLEEAESYIEKVREEKFQNSQASTRYYD